MPSKKASSAKRRTKQPSQAKPKTQSPKSKPKGKGLGARDLKVEMFINQLFGMAKGNVSKAAREAGMSEATATSEIYRTIKREDVQERLQQRLAQAQLDSDEVLGVLNLMLRSSIDDFLSEEGTFSFERARERGVMPLIKKIKFGRLGYYVESIELYSALEAAKVIAKLKNLAGDTLTNQANAERRRRERAEAKVIDLMERFNLTREEAVAKLKDKAPSAGKWVN